MVKGSKENVEDCSSWMTKGTIRHNGLHEFDVICYSKILMK